MAKKIRTARTSPTLAEISTEANDAARAVGAAYAALDAARARYTAAHAAYLAARDYDAARATVTE